MGGQRRWSIIDVEEQAMNEKEQIEQATAEGFLSLFNSQQGTDYQVFKLSDAPDVICKDSQGNQLNLELTMTEDKAGDIKAALGRSNANDLDALKEHLERVKSGQEDVQYSSLSGDVSAALVKCIMKKLAKRYGPNTALVVRDISSVDWDWDLEIDAIKERIASMPNHFDKGIWILNRGKTRLHRIT